MTVFGQRTSPSVPETQYLTHLRELASLRDKALEAERDRHEAEMKRIRDQFDHDRESLRLDYTLATETA